MLCHNPQNGCELTTPAEVQQSFSQIISSDSFGNNNVNIGMIASPAVSEGTENGSIDVANCLLQGSNGDQISSNFDTDVVEAFLKGVEEASRFLPKYSGYNKDKLVDKIFHGSSNSRGQKKRYSREEHLDNDEVGRINKVLMPVTMPYETSPDEVFNEMMLSGYETCKEDMDKLRGSMIIEVVKTNRNGRSKAVCLEDFKTDPSEVLVLIDLFNSSTLMDKSIFFDMPNPKDTVLNNIRKMQPNVFIQSIVNWTSSTSFQTRFREVLFYYTALFDMLEATTPPESESRLVLEQGMFGRSALNIIACECLDPMDRPENYTQWQVRNQSAGLRQLPLKPSIVQEVMENVMKLHHKDFLLGQDNDWLIQGWKGRVLFAQSTWVAEDLHHSDYLTISFVKLFF
ncbi:Scarecrow-like protein 9 [Dichanthelium oligosanthes]|uniref:Scarecrow-like protein 9 n=1 Tax=Dichanthelium oligosanthes TaxID=888268 RepID=A0A1E5VA62_9POAL|nr:Scarecrow-like protein 9 [Dichanthelium oligosanthes]